jgi:hypothetical protein
MAASAEHPIDFFWFERLWNFRVTDITREILDGALQLVQ